ncbi:MAG TPA: CRISPR system precrRNA processing endoribonuclease RAMP protein Cas6 [Candidatus Dormibacteraeota bacterium]|nr:CRISPR system precrRNA processing endoribonuclease RAMP protein Cas6 [Candidatus Dormibacteraeota bacterium]
MSATEPGLHVHRQAGADRQLEAGLPPRGGEIETLRRCWRSLGVRRLALEWELGGPTRLRPGLAGELRSALGPALRLMGAHEAFAAVHGAEGVPAFWFVGWDCPEGPVTTVRAEARCLGALARAWPELAAALGRLRLTAVGGGLVGTRHLRLRWLPEGREDLGFGPAVPEPELGQRGGACLVEAMAPLCVRSRGRILREPPPPEVLVRSAGERLRQLCERWGEEGDLPAVVGRAVREARHARFSWARLHVAGGNRRSSRTDQEQRLVGVRGVMAYEGMSPLAMDLLILGAELGVGKDTAFGCGTIRVFRATG